MHLRPLIVRTAMAALVAAGSVLVPDLTPATAAAAQAKKLETSTLTITGMTCGGCAVAVKMAAKKVDGVTEVTVNYEKGRAEVTYDPAKTTPEKIAAAITKHSGFKASTAAKSL